MCQMLAGHWLTEEWLIGKNTHLGLTFSGSKGHSPAHTPVSMVSSCHALSSQVERALVAALFLETKDQGRHYAEPQTPSRRQP